MPMERRENDGEREKVSTEMVFVKMVLNDWIAGSLGVSSFQKRKLSFLKIKDRLS